MAFYNALDESINETLLKNSQAVSKSIINIEEEKGHPAMRVVLAVICVLIPFIVTKCS